MPTPKTHEVPSAEGAFFVTTGERDGEAEVERVRQAMELLRLTGATELGFAGIQFDLNASWRKLPSGEFVAADVCDHDCRVAVPGEREEGEYDCPAAISHNRGASAKWFTPAEVVLDSISTMEAGLTTARTEFFNGPFEAYCRDFNIPPHIAEGMRALMDDPTMEINLFGGNPEMHQEIATIIKVLRESGHRVHLTTTGRRFMRDPQFVEDIIAAPPNLIALSADDFIDAEHIHHLASLTPEEVMAEWRKIPKWYGQRQKAYEAIYTAKLAQQREGFPPLLFNMVLHPGNLANAGSIVEALTEHFPGVLVNPFPAQSAFYDGERAFSPEHAPMLRDLIDQMIEIQTRAIQTREPVYPLVPRLHYWLMLRAAFDYVGDDHPELALPLLEGEGLWLCYQNPAAGRYLQVSKGGVGKVRGSVAEHPGGCLGCFWRTDTVTREDKQVWDMEPDEVTDYTMRGKVALAVVAKNPCKGCVFPRLTYDMMATETGMHPDVLPFYLARRATAMGF